MILRNGSRSDRETGNCRVNRAFLRASETAVFGGSRGCSSMAEQKLPKLLAFAVFRHVPCKPRQKSPFQIKSLAAWCKPRFGLDFGHSRTVTARVAGA